MEDWFMQVHPAVQITFIVAVAAVVGIFIYGMWKTMREG